MKLLFCVHVSQADDKKPSACSHHCLMVSCLQYWKLTLHCSAPSTCTKLQPKPPKDGLKAQHGSCVRVFWDESLEPCLMLNCSLEKANRLNSSSPFFFVTTYNCRLFKQPWRCVVDKLSSLTQPRLLSGFLQARCSRRLQILAHRCHISKMQRSSGHMRVKRTASSRN